MSKKGQPESQNLKKRKFLFIPLKRLLPYLGLIIGILMIIFQQSLWTYTESIVGRLLIDIIRIETRDQYTITYEKVRFNVFKDQLRLTKFSVIEEGSSELDETDSIQKFALSSSLLSLDVNSFLDVLIRREINIAGLELTKPSIRIIDRNRNTELDSLEAKSSKVFTLIGKYLDNFEIKELKISNAAIEYVRVLPDTTYSVKLSDISLLVESFQIENPLGGNEQSISTSQFEFEILGDTISMVPGHLVSFSKIKGSSTDSLFRIENLKISPIASNSSESRLDMMLSYVQLIGFHPRKLIFEDTLRARKFQIGNGQINVGVSGLSNNGPSTFEYKLPTILLGGIKTQKIDLNIIFPFGGARHTIDVKKFELLTSQLHLYKNSFRDIEKIIKSLDINIKTREYSVDFAIPGHRLTSNNIILDTKRGYFSTDDLQILPQTRKKSQFKTQVSNIQLWGLNISQALFNKRLESRKVLIRNLSLDVITDIDSQESARIDITNIHPMIGSIFSSIKVLDLQIRDSDLSFKNLETNSEITFDNFDLRLGKITIDSSTFKNPKQILGAQSITLQGNGMKLLSKSGIKEINSGAFYLNTLNQKLRINDIKYTSLYPSYQEVGSEQINMSKLKLFEFIHSRTLVMDSLRISELVITINDLDSIYIPTDSLIFTSAPEFLDSLNIRHISVLEGELNLKTKSDIGVTVKEFTSFIENVNVIKKRDKLYWKSYQFYAENGPFSVELNEFNHSVSGKSMIISKADSTLRINQLRITPVKTSASGSIADIIIPNLLLTGVDLSHLLDSSLIVTRKTLFIDPTIYIHHRLNELKTNTSDTASASEARKNSDFRFISKEVSVLNGSLQARYENSSEVSNYAKADWIDLTLNNFRYMPETILSTNLQFIDHFDLSAGGVTHSGISVLDTISIDRLKLNSEDYILGEIIHIKGNSNEVSFDISIPSLMLSSSMWLNKILTNEYALDSLHISKPTLVVELDMDSLTKKNENDNPAFSLMNIIVDSGRMELSYNNNQYNIPEFNLDVQQFDTRNHFKDLYSKDISLNIKGLKNILPESFSTVNIKEVNFSTGGKTLQFQGLEIDPIYDKLDYGRELGYQTDWINMTAGTLDLSGIDFPSLIESGYFNVSEVLVDNVDIKIYRDKNIPFPANQVRYMPHRMIANIKFPITIESFVTNNTSILYEELTEEADSAGFVKFINLTGGISNITNDSLRLTKNPMLQMAASAVFMESGNLHADFEFDLTDPEGKHYYSAYLSKMPLTNLNKILEPNVNVRIKSGTLTSMNMQVQGNRDYSIGTMRFLYNDLHFNLIGRKKGSTSSMGPAMGSFFANTFIVNRNNPKLVLVRNGNIYFERDTTKSVINYITKATLSGVVSSIGARNNRKYIRKLNDEAIENLEKRKKRERVEKEKAITSRKD